jgi:hypothetical protein
MSIRAAVGQHALDNAAIAAIVVARVYTAIAPQNPTPPYLLIQHIFGVPDHHMTAESGIEKAGVQFDAFAETEAAAAELIDKVRLAFDGFRGTMGDSPNTIRVACCHMGQRRSMGATPYRGNEFGLFRVTADFEIIYDITVATFA